ncbi:MAG: glycosyltransferase family 39 protein [Chloroflexota bacterium]
MTTATPEPIPRSDRTRTLLAEVRRWPMAYALAASALTYSLAAGNTFRLIGIVAWVGAVACWIYAWWPRSEPGIKPAHRPRWWVLISLAAIVALGIFFRFHRLHDTPYEPTSDHAEKLLDVQDILDGQRPIFFNRNTGREPAHFYVIAGMVRGLGLPADFDTMKLGTAAIDVLTIPAIYLLAAELGGPAVGLAAALAYSISAWPVGIARAGLRFPYAPLPTALALWLLFRYLRRGDRRDALLLGATLGIGLYGYSPFRVVPPVIPLAFGLAWLMHPGWRARGAQLLGDLLLAGLTSLVVFIPLGRFMLEQPNMFWYRAASRAVGDEGRPPDGASALLESIQVFLLNNWNAALAFNLRGDSTYVNAYRWAPFLDTLSGVVFLAGVGLAVRAIVLQRDVRWLIVLISFPVLFLSSTLAVSFPIENPSVNRAGPVLPVAFALVGLGLGRLMTVLRQTHEVSTRYLAAILLVCGLSVAAAENYERYFIRFDAQYRDFVLNTSEVADVVEPELDNRLTLARVYAFNWPFSYDTRNLAIALGDIRWAARNSVPEQAPIPSPVGSDMLLIINREDQRRLDEIRLRWPTATIRLVPSSQAGREFFIVRVPAQ